MMGDRDRKDQVLVRNALADITLRGNATQLNRQDPTIRYVRNALADICTGYKGYTKERHQYCQDKERNTSVHAFGENSDSLRPDRTDTNRYDPIRKRRIEALDAKAIQHLLGIYRCACSNECQGKFSDDQIMFWRQMVHTLPIGESRMSKIKEILRTTSLTSPEKHTKNQMFKVEQQTVCRKFFIDVVLCVSESTINRAKQDLTSSLGLSKWPKQLTHSAKGSICVGFIKAYVESTCDRDPAGALFRMPVSLSRCDLYHLYQVIYKNDSLKKSMFYNILAEKFSNVVFSKTQKYTKCKDCNEFRELIAAEKTVELKKETMLLRDCHLKEQQMEREAYYVRRAQAEMRKNDVLSIILDGMDQKKTNLPSYAHDNNPVGSGQTKLRTHVTGSIVHGRGKYFFIDCNQYPHDTNLTLSCLLKILLLEAKDGKLPPTLYVQLDNTCRENKNKFFIGMMGILIKLKIVREIWISFLMVGHTHEDVDQCFSRISVKMKEQNTLTLTELHDVIRRSQSPTPKSSNTGTVWNISKWLVGTVNQIHNVTFPKLYRLYMDEVEHVSIQYKILSTDDVWHPTPDEKPLEIFQIRDGEQIVPEGLPDIVLPNFKDEDIQDLKRSIAKDFELVHFKEGHVSEWTSFFQNLDANDVEEWPVSSLKECCEISSQSSTLSQKEREILARYKAKKSQLKQVYTNLQNGDRRQYIEGDMVIFTNDSRNNVGKISKIQGDFLEVIDYNRNGNKFTQLATKRKVQISCCHPGSFELCKDNTLPKRIKKNYF